jgi:hypothetical protein
MGFTRDDYAEALEVLPENWPTWKLFAEFNGQWRVGFGGAFALDYTPLFMRMEKLGLSDADWEHTFADIRLMEAAALDEMKKA